jgi:predicted nucleic acid-binding protein
VKVLIDLNVLLDVIQRREPHYAAWAKVLSLVAEGTLAGAVPGHALTTLYYVVDRFAGRDRAVQAIDWLLRDFEVVPPGREIFLRARALAMTDFEDAVVASCAETSDCDRIVTRNVVDFESSPVASTTPAELLADLVPVDEAPEDAWPDPESS